MEVSDGRLSAPLQTPCQPLLFGTVIFDTKTSMIHFEHCKGCSVVCWDMNETENEKTVQHIRETIGQEAYGFKVDVSDRTNVYKAARESEILAGKVTILVNNAGIVGGKDFLDLDDKVIEKVLEGTDMQSMSHSISSLQYAAYYMHMIHMI